MGKVTWGAIVAVVAAIVVVVLAERGVFRTSDEVGDTAGTVETSTKDEQRGQDGGLQGDEPAVTQDMATESGEAHDADDGKADDAGGGTAGDADRSKADDADGGKAGDADGRKAGDADSGTAGDADSGTAGDVDGGTAGDANGGQSAAREPGPDEDDYLVPEEAAGEDSDEGLQEDAESFVRQLAEPSDEPVIVEDAEDFVGADRQLASEASVASESEASGTMLPEAEELDDVGTSDSGVAGADTASVTESPDPETGMEAATQPESRNAGTGDAPEADDRASGMPDARQPAVELPVSEQAPVTIAELLGAEEAIASDAVFYVHTVQPEDIQGIWGIVHDGILENFAAGVAVHRGESTETYRVDIPRHADERRPDSTSSFLGRVIFDKTQKSYVYNYQTDRLGRNPDLIVPGQEIVIVSFTPKELIEIYKYFVREEEVRGSDS